MNKFLPIYYSGFWDVPSAFLTEYEKDLYLFWRNDFDEELDDYPPNYHVYLIRNVSLKNAFEPALPPYKFVNFRNTSLLLENEVIGEIPTKEVIFDITKREFINSKVFRILLKN